MLHNYWSTTSILHANSSSHPIPSNNPMVNNWISHLTIPQPQQNPNTKANLQMGSHTYISCNSCIALRDRPCPTCHQHPETQRHLIQCTHPSCCILLTKVQTNLQALNTQITNWPTYLPAVVSWLIIDNPESSWTQDQQLSPTIPPHHPVSKQTWVVPTILWPYINGMVILFPAPWQSTS